MPIDLSLNEKVWFNSWASEVPQRGVVDLDMWTATRIELLLSQPKNRGIRDEFFHDEHYERVNEIYEIVSGRSGTDLSDGGLPSNRVLLEDATILRPMRHVDGRRGAHRDLSPAIVLIEELVAYAVGTLVVGADSWEAQALETLPAVLRSRVVVVDKRFAYETARRIMQPVADELRIDISETPWSVPVVDEANDYSGDVILAVIHLVAIIMGMQYRLQIETDLSQMRYVLEALSAVCRSAQATGTLAVLRGLVARYMPRTIQTIKWRPVEGGLAAVDGLPQLMDAPSYRDMSVHSHAIGYPLCTSSAIERLEQSAHQIASRLQLPGLAIDSASLNIAAPDPEDDSGVGDRFVNQLAFGYLPPVISLQAARARSVSVWHQRGMAAIPPGPLDDGWIWDPDFESNVADDLKTGRDSLGNAWLKVRL